MMNLFSFCSTSEMVLTSDSLEGSLSQIPGWLVALKPHLGLIPEFLYGFKKNDDFRQETFVKWVFLHIYRSGYGCSLFLLKD